ncbi:MAG TPA: glutamine-hydrolyzing GMP synthase [Patescibacteria group bacterium]
MSQKLAILDAGAQYGKVIDRRVRELKVESDILPLTTPTHELKKYRAFIISGGPESVYGEQAPKYNPEIFSLGKPILGICYGLQLMNYVHGGTVLKKNKREDGPCRITINADSPLFQNLAPTQDVLMTHGDSADQVATSFKVTGDSDGLVAAIENPKKKMYGVQFHPEVDLTLHGKDILSNFLFSIAGFKGDFTMADREQLAVEYIQKTVGEQQVLLLISGGVDSTVCAALLGKALKPQQLHLVHIDHGFMRKNESAEVKKALSTFGLHVKVIDASDTFFNATTIMNGSISEKLSEATNAEVKRHIIGNTFIEVAKKAIADLDLDPDTTFLAQGTLRPDLIESASDKASSNAQKIKTHHNDSPLVRELRDKGRVVEPLQEYHKDEVRILGKQLGLPDEIVWRQPFPGPGLAIRTLCATKPYLEKYDRTYKKLQAFTTDQIAVTLLPVQTVGVQGDGRTYSYAVGLSGQSEWSTLRELALEIPKTIHDVNRVVYIFGEKISSPVKEITPTTLSESVVDQLRAADSIVNQILLKYDLMRSLSQVPVILLPLHFGHEGARSIAIRTFITNDFMTGVPALPGKEMPLEAVNEMVTRILEEVPGIARVMYDLTSKPPGTTEWE